MCSYFDFYKYCFVFFIILTFCRYGYIFNKFFCYFEFLIFSMFSIFFLLANFWYFLMFLIIFIFLRVLIFSTDFFNIFEFIQLVVTLILLQVNATCNSLYSQRSAQACQILIRGRPQLRHRSVMSQHFSERSNP